MANKKQGNEIQMVDAKTAIAAVQEKVDAFQKQGELVLPADYSAGNALKAAMLRLDNDLDKKTGVPIYLECTPKSTLQALLDMVVQGLDPGKKQCYFIKYGDQLTLMRSYMGTVLVAKRFGDVENVFAQVIYQDDEFEFETDPTTGIRKVTKHASKMSNIDSKKIVGAYATVTTKGGLVYQEVMTIDEIRAAWGQGATKGDSPAHRKFAGEMAKKTVINRACKLFINTASDHSVLSDSFNRTSENERLDFDEEKIVEVPESDVTAEAYDSIMAREDHNGVTAEESPGFEELTEEEKKEIEAEEMAAATAEQEGE